MVQRIGYKFGPHDIKDSLNLTLFAITSSYRFYSSDSNSNAYVFNSFFFVQTNIF